MFMRFTGVGRRGTILMALTFFCCMGFLSISLAQTPTYCVSQNLTATVGNLISGTTTTPQGTSTAQFKYPVNLSWDCTQGPASGSECGACLYVYVYKDQGGQDILVTQGSDTIIDGNCGSTGNAFTETVAWPPTGAANTSSYVLTPGFTYFMAIWVKPYNPYSNSPCSDANDPTYNKLGNYEYAVPSPPPPAP